MYAPVRRRARPPKFLPNPPVAGLHRFGFHSAPIAPGLVNRLDVSEDGAYVLFRLKAPPRRGEVGRWRSLFIAFPRGFMVLFFCRLYGLRAEEAAGVCGRGGAALRRGGRFRQTAS